MWLHAITFAIELNYAHESYYNFHDLKALLKEEKVVSDSTALHQFYSLRAQLLTEFSSKNRLTFKNKFIYNKTD